MKCKYRRGLARTRHEGSMENILSTEEVAKIQKQSEANAEFSRPRSALGISIRTIPLCTEALAEQDALLKALNDEAPPEYHCRGCADFTEYQRALVAHGTIHKLAT